MASPQKENGYTAIANEILERLAYPGMNGSEYRVLLLVVRKTYGFNKKQDKISLSQFQKGTLMARANVVRTIKSLVAKRLLLKEKALYKFNKNWEEWLVVKRIPSSQMATKGSSQMDNGVVAKRIHTKDTITKEKKDTYSCAFESFWKLYPKKKEKPEAYKAWKNLKPSEELQKKIKEAVNQYKQKEEWKKENGRFIIYPERFIKRQKWEDEITTKKSKIWT